MLKSHLGPLYPFLKIFLLLMVILTAARSCLVFIFSQHLHGVEQLGHVFLQGIRIDFLLFSALFMLPLFAYTVLHTLIGTTTAGMMRIVVYWTVMAVVLILFFELITPWYMFEYGARPERKFFEYLSSPREVMLMLWGMYGFLMLGILLVVTVSVPVIYRLAVSFYSSAGRWSVPQMLVILPLVVLLMLLGIRSSLDHRPLNPSTVAFTDDTIANALPLNSLYSVLYAAYSMKNEAAASDVYGHMAKQEILNRVYREHEKHNSGNFNAVNYPTPPFPGKNLVIILEESLGARFVGKLGGAVLTPKLDQLADEGWWFTHLYATGTRSVRGIEAVVTGFLPTPGRSVVKLPNSQSGFFTLASHLRQFGYRSRFYYGGNAHFDNMKGFFLGNGFHEVIEQSDFKNPKYVGSWGASDQDVFARIHQDLLEDPATPKLSVVLTTSNHTPFDYPTDIDAAFEPPLKSRENAIRYADAALGEFIARAKNSQYWDRTVFLIVADHDQKVSDFVMEGDLNAAERRQNYFPVAGFHIPGLILGGDIEPRLTDSITSQLDLPPTLLSLLGVNAPNPMIGIDLTRVGNQYQGRAIMQYNHLQAYLDGDSLVVLRPELDPLKGLYRNNKFIPYTSNQLDYLTQTALAHALWASAVYRDGSYR